MGKWGLRIMWEVDEWGLLGALPFWDSWTCMHSLLSYIRLKRILWDVNLLPWGLIPMPLKMLINESLLQTFIMNLLLLKLFCQESRELLTREGIVREVFPHSMNVCWKHSFQYWETLTPLPSGHGSLSFFKNSPNRYCANRTTTTTKNWPWFWRLSIGTCLF